MKAILRILFAIFIGWFGYKAIEQAYGPYDMGIFSAFQFLPFIFLIVSIIITLIIDSQYFRASRSLFQYSLSFIGIILLGIVIFKFAKDGAVRTSKTILRVSNFAGARYVWAFEFKVNGRFRIIEYDRLGQTIYTGSYTLNDSTIVIKETDYPSKRFPTKGFIHNDTLYWDNFENMQVVR